MLRIEKRETGPTMKQAPGSKPGPLSVPGYRTLTGILRLRSSSIRLDGLGCKGAEGYDDIHEGAQVTVTDQGGRVLGLGMLGSSVLEDTSTCRFSWSVSGLPDTAFYGVEMASQRRGRLRYSLRQLEVLDWKLESTLGR